MSSYPARPPIRYAKIVNGSTVYWLSGDALMSDGKKLRNRPDLWHDADPNGKESIPVCVTCEDGEFYAVHKSTAAPFLEGYSTSWFPNP